jgi:hypothetical protein
MRPNYGTTPRLLSAVARSCDPEASEDSWPRTPAFFRDPIG